MNLITQSLLKTLQKTQVLLENLSNIQLTNTTVPPYYSSIGSHVRHILDFYDCIFNLDENNKIDLTARSRNKEVECDCDCAKAYLTSILNRLKTTDVEPSQVVVVIDDLGLGKTEIPYTFGALLAQANSHTIHHYAIVNFILDRLGISFEDPDFGYNPTTPKGILVK